MGETVGGQIPTGFEGLLIIRIEKSKIGMNHIIGLQGDVGTLIVSGDPKGWGRGGEEESGTCGMSLPS